MPPTVQSSRRESKLPAAAAAVNEVRVRYITEEASEDGVVWYLARIAGDVKQWLKEDAFIDDDGLAVGCPGSTVGAAVG